MITLIYKTTLNNSDGTKTTKDQRISFETREKAEACQWSFDNGDFVGLYPRGLICHDFKIEED